MNLPQSNFLLLGRLVGREGESSSTKAPAIGSTEGDTSSSSCGLFTAATSIQLNYLNCLAGMSMPVKTPLSIIASS